MGFKKNRIEITIHLLFWIFYFTAINVEWSSDWLDRSLRPNTPAPLSVLIFPFYFYVNAFWLLPKYFNRRYWHYYLGAAALIFAGPELIRIMIYTFRFEEIQFARELFSRDSFFFGAPSPFFIALNCSIIYRFTKDWFVNKAKIERMTAEADQESTPPAYHNTDLLSDEEIQELRQKLKLCIQEEVFLNPDLNLRALAKQVHTTEKKLSFFLNQKLDTNFYDYLNKYRVEKFKNEVAKKENENLSIVGIAMNCGFKSKSSFYRAFKAQVGKSPSAYLKTIKASPSK